MRSSNLRTRRSSDRPAVGERPLILSLNQARAVTFDVGGTLIQPWPSVGAVYAAVAARAGFAGLDAVLLDSRFRSAWGRRADFFHRVTDWEGLVDEVFSGLVDPPPSRSFFPELFAEFARPSAWRLFDDVLPILDELASLQVPMAVVSNWDERLVPLLQRLRLDRFFDVILVSYDVGFCKPSPVIFEEAERKLRIPAGEILHVGDSHEEDVAGAMAAGFQAVRVDRALAPGGPPGVIRSLTEVAARVRATRG